MSLASLGYREVESIVETWTKKYQYHISLLDSKPNEVKYFSSNPDSWSNSVCLKPNNQSLSPQSASTLPAPAKMS